MKKFNFMMLPKLDNEDDFSKKLKIGDCFLYGSKMKSQIETKKEGDEISYFRVIRIENKNVEYSLQFDILEKSEKN